MISRENKSSHGFGRAVFSRRYSSGVNDAHQTDLNAMTKLREDEDTDISTFKCDIFESFFTDNQFNVNTVNTKTFIALLASKTPKSFISGAKVDLSVTLKLSNAKEFHHIFPDKYLQSMGKEKRERYQLANFCFLNNADNQKIKDKVPAEYAKYLNPESILKFYALQFARKIRLVFRMMNLLINEKRCLQIMQKAL